MNYFYISCMYLANTKHNIFYRFVDLNWSCNDVIIKNYESLVQNFFSKAYYETLCAYNIYFELNYNYGFIRSADKRIGHDTQFNGFELKPGLANTQYF